MDLTTLKIIDNDEHKELASIMFDDETKSFSKAIISDFGKSFNLDDEGIEYLFYESINLGKYNGTYILNNNDLEKFKEDNNIELLGKKINVPNFSLREKSIELHPLVKENIYYYKADMIMNNKTIKFLIDNGFNIPREDKYTGFKFGNKVFHDFTNLKQNEFYFNISENKIGLDYKPNYKINKDSFMFKNNLLFEEMLSNFMKYAEKEFNFEWTKDHYKFFKKIFDKSFSEKGLNKYEIINNVEDYSNIPGYVYGYATLEEIKHNNYMQNIIGNSLNEMFRKLHRYDLNEILKGNFEEFNKDKSDEIALINIATKYDNNLINRLKEQGYIVYRKEFEAELYVTLKEDRNGYNGNLEKSIYVFNSLNKIDMNLKFVDTNTLLDLLKPNIEIKPVEIINELKEIEENNEINEKIESNKLTLDDFVKKYDIDLKSDLGKDLLNIFEEKQKGLFEKLVDKTKGFINFERDR